jgi:hypothetical protein
MEFVIIAAGLIAVVFRKQIVAFKNGTQPTIPHFAEKKAGADTVKRTLARVVTLQEIMVALVGSLFVIGGVLLGLGVIHMKP